MYTFVIRSKDRQPGGTTNDFKITLPYLQELAASDYWTLSVQRCVFSKAPGTNIHGLWFDNRDVDIRDQYVEPHTNKTFTTDVIEVHINLAGACKGHDTHIGGGRVVHLVTPKVHSTFVSFESGINEATEYKLSRPNLTEMSVQVKNKAGGLAKTIKIDDWPEYIGEKVYAEEEDPPDWMMVLQLKKIDSQY
jgi:hypothetical protein